MIDESSIFRAIETRFKADSGLMRTGRKLYDGLAERTSVTTPFCNMIIRGVDHSLHAFDKRIDTYDIEIEIRSGKLKGQAASNIVSSFRSAFDYQIIVSADFERGEMIPEGQTGPEEDDATFDVLLIYSLYVTWITKAQLV